jgi:NAD(P)-dependent dehydrogenase (short-subunit alcohol dehydrogenase family)
MTSNGKTTSSTTTSDLSGKTALVTGASSGIGLEASVKLAARGATVLMVARDPARGEAALAEVVRRSGSDKVELLLCDFASQKATRALADKVRERVQRLDILVNNAGSVSPKRQVTEDGIEQTFAVNHLGYFLLSNLLLDLVVAAAPARIVNVSSIGHRQGTLDFDDLGFERGYGIMKAYSRSKLANVLFTSELSRRLDGKRVTVNALHPGAVATHIWSHAPAVARPILAVAKLFMISPEEGGDRIVYLATSPEVDGKSGGYYEKNRLVTPSRLARDTSLATRLWDVSSQLVHLD